LRLKLWLAVFLTLVPAELFAQHSKNPKLDRAIGKANSELIVAMKTGDAATIAAPYTENASFIMIDGGCIQGRTEIANLYRDRFARTGLTLDKNRNSKKLVVDNDLAYELGDGKSG
jgi:ketosteroid isomerase-like protein